MDVDLTIHSFTRSKIAYAIQVVCDGEEALSWISKWDKGELLPVVILTTSSEDYIIMSISNNENSLRRRQ